MASDDGRLSPSICYTMTFFKDALREYRKVDDNIMLRLNTTDTHHEATCATFFNQLAEAYKKRENVIDYCIQVMDQNLDAKRKKLEEDPDDSVLKSQTYTEELKRRMVWNEYTVEDIVRDRSLTVFKNKCRVFSIPDEFTKFLNKNR